MGDNAKAWAPAPREGEWGGVVERAPRESEWGEVVRKGERLCGASG